MKIYVMRHGETAWNAEGKIQGRADIPLNEKGRELARKTSEALKDIPFTRVYTSPLIRAKETAMIVKGDRQIPVIEDERIQEISFGICEGCHCSPELFDAPDPNFRDFFLRPESYIPPKGGESIEEMTERTSAFFNELIHDKTLEKETILVSSHGAALRGILATVYQHDKADFWAGGVYKNCAVTIVEVENGIPKMLEEAKVYYTI